MQSQKLVVTQKQQLKMSPQMYQSLEILALPVMDLRERVQEEMEKNPALEMKEASSVSYERISQPIPAERDYFENSSDPGFTSSYSREDSDAKQKFLEGAFSHSESLQEHLFMQLHMLPLSDEELKTGEIIISHLDDNGFCRKSMEEVVPEELQDYAAEMISKIQNFDPPGVCTEGPIESLAMQARMSSSAPPYSELVIRKDLELLRRGKYQEAAKRHGITADEIMDILEFIKTLTPYPGQQFESEPTHYIIPDLIIRKHEGKLRLFLNDDQIPELSIDPNFVSMADDEHHPSKEAERYIQQAVRDARWLINSIEMRSNTLRKVGAALLKYQYDFFLSGPKSLHPLTLRDIADEISVHETTVSRISQSKFIQTDWGIFPIKYFFSSAVNSTRNTQPDYSKTSVKEIMKEIIEEYSGSKRLSDQKISNLLAERGIKIARRTVAKYRKELHIDSSFDRNSTSSSS